MWPFKKRRPVGSEDTLLRTCNFEIARRELADFFRIANEDAASKGQEVVYREEFVRGWERFAQNPCFDTATDWLLKTPDYKPLLMSYFSECCPGGRFARYESMLGGKFRE